MKAGAAVVPRCVTHAIAAIMIHRRRDTLIKSALVPAFNSANQWLGKARAEVKKTKKTTCRPASAISKPHVRPFAGWKAS
jgi:hypothetical protein